MLVLYFLGWLKLSSEHLHVKASMIEFESGMLEYSTCVCTAALSGSVMEASVEVLEAAPTMDVAPTMDAACSTASLEFINL